MTLTDELRERVGELAEATGLPRVLVSSQLRDTADRALRRAVEDARAAGHTWQEIGDVLRTTRQAAFQRFGRPIDPRTGEAMSDALITDADNRASSLFARLADGDWATVADEFDATMAAALPADKLAATWAQVIGMVGAYEGMGDPFSRAQGDYSVVDVPLRFEAGEMKGRVSYDRQGRVAGLFILNPDVP